MKSKNLFVSEAARLLGKIGRAKRTAKQAQASRQNGKLGGRPKKTLDKPGRLGYRDVEGKK